MDEEEFYTVVQICDALKKTDVDISELLLSAKP